MNKSIQTTAALLIALSLLSPSPAHADGFHLEGSGGSMFITSVVSLAVVTGPFLLVSAGGRGLSDASGSDRSHAANKREMDAGPIPDMRIKSVDHDEQGGRRVALEDPINPENKATLSWTQRTDDPAAQFVVGQTVAFAPSPKGAGWVLRAENGHALTYIPTVTASQDHHSGIM